MTDISILLNERRRSYAFHDDSSHFSAALSDQLDTRPQNDRFDERGLLLLSSTRSSDLCEIVRREKG